MDGGGSLLCTHTYRREDPSSERTCAKVDQIQSRIDQIQSKVDPKLVEFNLKW